MDPLSLFTIISSLIGAGGTLANLFGGNKNKRMQQGQFGGGVPEGVLQVPRFSSEQNDVLQQLLTMGLGGLRNTPSSFGPIAQNAQNRFSNEVIPSLAERFGSLNSKRSSAFEGALTGAQRQLQENLAAQEQGFNQQNRGQLLQLLGLGLQSPFESIYKKRQPGFFENAATSAIPAAIQYAPQLSQVFSQLGKGN